jgi:8-oxo-dGTP pyrophosphatase MutT (NUDIX family)
MSRRDHELHQIGALPFLVNPDGGVDVCLVTSRGGGRWIIPKGNPIRGLAPHEVAAREAFEEAGLVGQAEQHCIGTFKFTRQRDGHNDNCSVDVYALKVERQMAKWAEMDQRSFLRCSVETALSLICLPGLSALIEKHVAAEGTARFI